MEAWDDGSTFDARSVEFLDDVERLPAQRLREKYASEATSHRNMLRREQKGFEIDPAWRDFREFLRSMGPKPADGQRWTIDRVDASVRRYGPGLCRWATADEQTANRPNTVWITHEGARMRLSEAAEKMGLSYKRAHYLWSTRGTLSDEKPSAGKTGAYCPLRYETDPAGLARWRIKYEAWLKRVRPDRKPLAPPEVFDIVHVSAAYNEIGKWVSSYVVEVAPSEHEEADAFWRSKLGVIYKSAPAWVGHAITALCARNPELGARFSDALPAFWTLAEWDEFLTAPAEPKRPW
jgi:hypothetical protein